MTHALAFEAVAEARPGRRWRARWNRSWPAYRGWFLAGGGDGGPGLAECRTALAGHMPELLPLHAELTRLSGGGDRAARFLSGWCPPPYLAGCSVAAHSDGGATRLVRNYDLSPELNEGLLLRSEWTGVPVMGMIEFLWGLSDGINGHGLALALAFGGRREVCEGFGVTTVLRYVLETCRDVPGALAVLRRVPSHMAYNIVLADRVGNVASVELIPGGGMRHMAQAIATNHQHGGAPADRAGFTRTIERRAHLEILAARGVAPEALARWFLEPPLFQTDYDRGFGTLFTAEYDPAEAAMALHWPGQSWRQRLSGFTEGSRIIRYAASGDGAPMPKADPWRLAHLRPFLPPGTDAAFDEWLAAAESGAPDWTDFAAFFGAPASAFPHPGGTVRRDADAQKLDGG